MRHGHMLLLIWPVLCIIPILKSQRMLNDSAPFFGSYVGSLKHRLFVSVYAVDRKVRSAACRDNAHMHYRKEKGSFRKWTQPYSWLLFVLMTKTVSLSIFHSAE